MSSSEAGDVRHPAARGMFHPGDALTVTQEDLRLMIDVNLGAAPWLTQAVAPYMRDRGSGSIVHVAARPGLEPTAGMAAAAVSRAALVYLTRVLDLELRPLGIGVNAVAPGAIADIIGYLASDAAPVSGAVVPAYGA
jgi:NAD(P)-dependent dehydrogenase (short-subunit alcohol dehydrogenase family)